MPVWHSVDVRHLILWRLGNWLRLGCGTLGADPLPHLRAMNRDLVAGLETQFHRATADLDHGYFAPLAFRSSAAPTTTASRLFLARTNMFNILIYEATVACITWQGNCVGLGELGSCSCNVVEITFMRRCTIAVTAIHIQIPECSACFCRIEGFTGLMRNRSMPAASHCSRCAGVGAARNCDNEAIIQTSLFAALAVPAPGHSCWGIMMSSSKTSGW